MITLTVWGVLSDILAYLLAFIGVGYALYERGRRLGFKDAERLYAPFLPNKSQNNTQVSAK